jgi:hypothetical protein
MILGYALQTASAFIGTCTVLVLLEADAARCQDQSTLDLQTLMEGYRAAATCWDRPCCLYMRTLVSGAYPRQPESGLRDQDFVFLRNGMRFERYGTITTTNPRDNKPSTQQFFMLFDERTYYQARKNADWDRYKGDTGRDFNDSTICAEFADESSGGYLFSRIATLGGALSSVPQYIIDNDNLQVISQEDIDGVICYVVEGDSRYGTVRVWIAPEKGFQAMKITISKKSGRHLLREGVRMEDEDVEESTETYGPFDVEEIEGTFYPISGDCTQEWVMKDKEHVKRLTKAKCSIIDLRPDFKALGAFTLAKIEGATIRDMKTPDVVYTVAKGRLTSNVANATNVVNADEAIAQPAEAHKSSTHLWIALPVVIVVVGLSWVAWRRFRTRPHN